MTPKEMEGYELAKGAMLCVCRLVLIALVGFLAASAIRLLFRFGVDDSDKDGFNRSGLTIHTDYKTGIQYLSDGHGGMVRRAEKVEK